MYLKRTDNNIFPSGMKCPFCGKEIFLNIRDEKENNCSGNIEVINEDTNGNVAFEYCPTDEDLNVGLFAYCDCNSWFEINDYNNIVYVKNPHTEDTGVIVNEFLNDNNSDDIIKVISGSSIYKCESKDDVVESILKDYTLYSVCIGELLNSVEIQGLNVQDVVDIFAKVMYIVEEDELVQRMNLDKDIPNEEKRWEW